MAIESRTFAHVASFDDVKCIKSTLGGGLLCIIEGKEVWIPQGMVDDNSEVWSEGDEGTLIISEFCAMKKGLV